MLRQLASDVNLSEEEELRWLEGGRPGWSAGAAAAEWDAELDAEAATAAAAAAVPAAAAADLVGAAGKAAAGKAAAGKAICTAKVPYRLWCGSAGPRGSFCQMRLGHLGGCTFGPDSCGMRRRRAVQKRASVSQLTQVMPKPRGRAPQGQAWDHFCGVWVPLSDDRHTQAMARASVSHLTRRMPKSYMDHAIDFGKHSKPVVLEHVRKYLETLKPGTRCTVGRAGTWNDKNDKRGGPLIERGLVKPNSGHYSEAGG